MTQKSDHTKIIELSKAGASRGSIAKKMNLSPSTVGRILKSVGVRAESDYQRVSRERRAQHLDDVKRLAAEGRSIYQIAKALKMGFDTVQSMCTEHGIETGAGKVGAPSKRDQLFPRAKQMWDAGQSQSQISKTLGVALGTLSRWFDQANVPIHRIAPLDQDYAANFGATKADRKMAASKGGTQAVANMADVSCLYCNEPFGKTRAESGRLDRNRFCSKEHVYAYRRENSGKTTLYICQNPNCDDPEFLGWTAQSRKFCSRECYFKTSRMVSEYGFRGHILASGYEAAFVGLCSVYGLSFEHFDRAGIVDTDAGQFGPDFVIQSGGDMVYVDTKGRERNHIKWNAFREQRGPLAILFQDDIKALMRDATSTTDLAKKIAVIAADQGRAS